MVGHSLRRRPVVDKYLAIILILTLPLCSLTALINLLNVSVNTEMQFPATDITLLVRTCP